MKKNERKIMSNSEDDIEAFPCAECGIQFGFQKRIIKIWKKSNKVFFCPNGHSLKWPEESNNKELEELESLRLEVKNLEEKLKSAQDEIISYKKKINDLELEVEIWKTSDKLK